MSKDNASSFFDFFLTKRRYLFKKIKSELKYLPKNINYLTTKKKRIIYIGCTGMQNLGDESILLAIKEIFKDEYFIYEISYNEPTSGSLIRNIFFQSPNCIMLGGGTIIKKGPKESYLKLFLAFKNQWENAKSIAFGPGVADINLALSVGFPTDTTAWVKILNRFDKISVRGPISRDSLYHWGVDKKISISGDPTVFYARKNLIRKPKKKLIGVNFADIKSRIYGLNNQNIESFGRSLLKLLHEDGWSVFLFPTTSSDEEYMRNKVFINQTDSLKIFQLNQLSKALDFIESLDLFVGQRLHSIIFASTVYTPFFAIEYEHKTSDFLRSININNDNIMRTDNLDAKIAFDKINLIYNDLEHHQEILYKNVQALKTQLLLEYQDLKNYI